MGLAIAAPVGPIGVLVIQRTLAHGPRLGLATGFGAALADGVYGAVGAYGVTAVIDRLQAARTPLAWCGAAFLLWLAWGTWRGASEASGVPRADEPLASQPALGAAFASTFALTLSNPATVMSFIAIFGALAAPVGASSPAWMALGVMVGSALWWLFLCGLIASLRERFGARARRAVARVSAVTLVALALWSLAQTQR